MHDIRKPALSSQSSHGVPSLNSCSLGLMRDLGSGVQIVAGNSGDHVLVLQLIEQSYQASIAEDFQSRLDDPAYEPCDRILLRREGEILGHVQVTRQIGWFQQQRIPLAKIQDFVTLPEYQSLGYDQALLRVAEETAVSEGSVVGLVRTDRPEWFRTQGWSICRGQGHTRASTHSILSHFDAQLAQPKRKKSAIEVRAWRHFEVDSLRRVYGQISNNMWGCGQRSEPGWQWLMGRKAHDQVLIAVKRDGKNSIAPHAGESPHVVAYAVVRDSSIVEMFSLPGYCLAPSQLVARACRDAIDRDHRFVSLHTTAADPMHELLVTAGGSWIANSAAHGGVWMVKLLSPERWVERLYPILHQRSREAGISTAQQIDFSVADTLYRLTLTRRSSRLESSNESDTHVSCDWGTFQDLLMSNLTFSEANASELLKADDTTWQLLSVLFPPKLFWQSPFELLRL